MYILVDIRGPEGLQRLATVIRKSDPDSYESYGLSSVVARLQTWLSKEVVSVLVEKSYIDKDYRSTYYNFYAKKGRRYREYSLRLHLLSAEATLDPESLSLTTNPGGLEESYLGFMTLRPTVQSTFGRGIVSPRALSGVQGRLIVGRHKVHLLGYDLSVEGFPWMEQHTDISVCAHVTCWSILRHYSERYGGYRELLVYDVTRLAHEFDPGGLVPADGLQTAQAEKIFSEAGSYPIVCQRPSKDDDPADHEVFFRQLLAYLESGFPLFLALSTEHAVAAIGIEWRAEVSSDVQGVRHAWDMVKALVVVDDQDKPYSLLPRQPKAGADPMQSLENIESFIVPLPEKMYYPASSVDLMAYSVMIRDASLLDLPSSDRVIRYFVTTAAAFRRHVRNNVKEYDDDLLTVIMTLPLAQFVWVVEFASTDEWHERRVRARAIIDATASSLESNPLWMVFGPSQARVFLRHEGAAQKVLDLNAGEGRPGRYSRMEPNLKAV